MRITIQETFDKVWNHFVVEKSDRSADVDDCHQCMYRGPNGCKCAIGVLIPDNLYTESMEGIRIRALMYEHSELEEYLPSDLTFLTLLQASHDVANPSSFHESIESGLRLLANSYDLTILQ